MKKQTQENIKEDIKNIGDDIINKHMVIIKESANILSEEGDLITNIKGVGKVQNFTLDDYIDGLENIVDKKLDMYQDIKNKIKKYRKAKILNPPSLSSSPLPDFFLSLLFFLFLSFSFLSFLLFF